MTWFEDVFGFEEKSRDESCKDVRGKFVLTRSTDDHSTPHPVNANVPGGKWMPGWTLRAAKLVWEADIGPFETPTVRDLRARLELAGGSTAASRIGTLTFGHAIGEGRALSADPTNAGAVFQAASQFNCLEMVSPNVKPDAGVTGYFRDQTQGPAIAESAAAATVYRNYFHNGGQCDDNPQINTASDIDALLANDVREYWRMRNGYMLPKEVKISGDRMSDELVDKPLVEREIAARVGAGVHWSTQVNVIPGKGREFKFALRASNHRVCQVFSSAMPMQYFRSPRGFKVLARAILDGAYEACFLVATLIAVAEQRRVKVYLTMLGGGAFYNKSKWIVASIERSLRKFANAPLDVFLVHYSGTGPDGLYLKNLNPNDVYVVGLAPVKGGPVGKLAVRGIDPGKPSTPVGAVLWDASTEDLRLQHAMLPRGTRVVAPVNVVRPRITAKIPNARAVLALRAYRAAVDRMQPAVGVQYGTLDDPETPLNIRAGILCMLADPVMGDVAFVWKLKTEMQRCKALREAIEPDARERVIAIHELVGIKDGYYPKLNRALAATLRFAGKTGYARALPRAHVVGAGAVGLFSAMAAYNATFDVDVFEQRGYEYSRKQIVVVDPSATAHMRVWQAREYFDAAIPLLPENMQTQEDLNTGTLEKPPKPDRFEPSYWKIAFDEKTEGFEDIDARYETPGPSTAALMDIEDGLRHAVARSSTARIHYNTEYLGVDGMTSRASVRNLEAPGAPLPSIEAPDVIVVAAGASGGSAKHLRDWAGARSPRTVPGEHAYILYALFVSDDDSETFVPRSDIVGVESGANAETQRFRSRAFKSKKGFSYVSVAIDEKWFDHFTSLRKKDYNGFMTATFFILIRHAAHHGFQVREFLEPPILMDIQITRMDEFYTVNPDTGTLTVFVGDAAATPHFFSGSGLNTGFLASLHLSTLLESYTSRGFEQKALDAFQADMKKAVDTLHERSRKYIKWIESPTQMRMFDEFISHGLHPESDLHAFIASRKYT